MQDHDSSPGPAGPDRFGLIIGAMKCGTTTLFNRLAQHPEVAPSRVKEPSFFCDDRYEAGELRRYRELWEWEPDRHRIAIEASASYTKRPRDANCPERIAELEDQGADLRFLYCIRNPLDRILSHVYHGLYQGWTQALDEGISEHTLNVSRYAMQLEPYARRFGRERIYLVVLEQFSADPLASLRSICEFLGIDPDFPFPSERRPANQASDHYLEHPLWGRMRGVEAVRRLSHVVPAPLRRFALRRTGRRVEARREFTTAERAWVVDQLRPDLLRLRSDFGIDVEATWELEI